MELDTLDHEHVVQVQPAVHAMRTPAFVDPRLFQNFLVALQEQRGLKPDTFKIFVDDLNITVCPPAACPSSDLLKIHHRLCLALNLQLQCGDSRGPTCC